MRSEIKQKYMERTTEIIAKLNQGRGDNPVVLQECFAATIGIFESIFGRSSLQVEQLLGAVKQLRDVNPHPGVMDNKIGMVLQGALLNLKSELESGLTERIFDQAIGSAIADFIILSEKALADGQKDVSAVLASAALEDSLKRKAEGLGIDVEDKDLTDVLNALKAKSLFPAPQHKIVSSFVALRNKAMHAQWNKIFEPDVASMIAFLKTYVLGEFQ